MKAKTSSEASWKNKTALGVVTLLGCLVVGAYHWQNEVGRSLVKGLQELWYDVARVDGPFYYHQNPMQMAMTRANGRVEFDMSLKVNMKETAGGVWIQLFALSESYDAYAESKKVMFMWLEPSMGVLKLYMEYEDGKQWGWDIHAWQELTRGEWHIIDVWFRTATKTVFVRIDNGDVRSKVIDSTQNYPLTESTDYKIYLGSIRNEQLTDVEIKDFVFYTVDPYFDYRTSLSSFDYHRETFFDSFQMPLAMSNNGRFSGFDLSLEVKHNSNAFGWNAIVGVDESQNVETDFKRALQAWTYIDQSTGESRIFVRWYYNDGAHYFYWNWVTNVPFAINTWQTLKFGLRLAQEKVYMQIEDGIEEVRDFVADAILPSSNKFSMIIGFADNALPYYREVSVRNVVFELKKAGD